MVELGAGDILSFPQNREDVRPPVPAGVIGARGTVPSLQALSVRRTGEFPQAFEIPDRSGFACLPSSTEAQGRRGWVTS